MAAATTLPESNFRLERSVVPKHYELTIKSDLKHLAFAGKVEIDLEIADAPSSTNSITLHSAPSLKILSAVLSSSSLKSTSAVLARDIVYDSKLEHITVVFPNEVVALAKDQKYKLGLRFEGEIEGSMMGYYKSVYDDAQGNKAHYALTQFEPTAARRAFPCWDEPDFKATFGLTLLSRKGLTVLANMPVSHTFPDVGEVAIFPEEVTAQKDTPPSTSAGEEAKTHISRGAANLASDVGEGDGWIATTFERTPIMSTYLVAYANGDFRHLESSYTSPITGRKVPLRIYTTPEHIHQAEYALEVKSKVLPVYEQLFDIEYPLPKCDTLVASDFDAGAMENWGLITGRTVIYLIDPKNASIDSRKMTATVQSHECAHMWFGDVVTMRWWDNLWLNEAFATLMGEVISIAAVYPEWRPHSSFLNTHLRRALELDSQRSSHPVEMPCPDPEMINQIFDAISYSKGASVLRMLSNFIGEKTFLKGVSLYLKAHLYGNSRTADLWKGISEASGLDVAKIMANWTLKIGFPVITVEETAEGIKVRQNRYLSTGDPTPEEDQTLWYVPLELKTVGEDGKATIDHKAILEEREKTFAIKDVKSATYKLNAESAGVYRVVYSPERLTKLGDEASKSNSAFTLDDRIGLVQDAFVLAKAGYGKSSGALNLISKLATGEKEFLVWQEISAGIADLANVWWEQPQEVLDALDALSRKLFSPLVKQLGWEIKESDSSDERELRALAIAALAKAGDEATLKEVRSRFERFNSGDQDAIPGDFIDIVFSNVVRFGGSAEYTKIREIYKKPPTQQHKAACMRAATAVRDESLIQETIKFMNSDEVKMQDMMYFYAGLAANRASRRAIWAQLQHDLPALVVKFKGNFSLGRLVAYSFDKLTTKEDEKDVEAFFAKQDTKDYNQALQQGLDAVRAKTAWLARDKEDVESWMKDNKYIA